MQLTPYTYQATTADRSVRVWAGLCVWDLTLCADLRELFRRSSGGR